jgi:hypothetical protein
VTAATLLVMEARGEWPGGIAGSIEGGRKKLAGPVLGVVAHLVRGRLVLGATSQASDELRAERFTLAGELSGELRAPTTVSLWFTKPSRGHAKPLADVDAKCAMRGSA